MRPFSTQTSKKHRLHSIPIPRLNVIDPIEIAKPSPVCSLPILPRVKRGGRHWQRGWKEKNRPGDCRMLHALVWKEKNHPGDCRWYVARLGTARPAWFPFTLLVDRRGITTYFITLGASDVSPDPPPPITESVMLVSFHTCIAPLQIVPFCYCALSATTLVVLVVIGHETLRYQQCSTSSAFLATRIPCVVDSESQSIRSHW